MSAAAAAEATISRDQFKRLAEEVSKQATAILRERDRSDKAMDKKSALLQALLSRLREKLGLPAASKPTTRGFRTYEFDLREAVYTLALEHAKEPFDYQKIVDGLLKRAA